MRNSDYFRIGGFLVSISESLFAENPSVQEQLYPFRIGDREELSKCGRSEADIQIVDQRSFGSSLFDFREGELFYEEQNCSNPTKFYLMPDGSYRCEIFTPDMKLLLVFHITSDWSEFSVCYEAAEDNEAYLFGMVGVLFSMGVLYRDACVFHGVAMNYDGKGILVMAPSGVGKSTHTNRWEAMHLAEIINGDRCLCRKEDGQWFVYGMPWAGSSGKCLQKKVPVSWIIQLKRGNENRVEQISAFEKEIFLLKRIYSPVTAGEQQENAFAFAHELSETAEVIDFYCLPDENSVLVLKEAIDRKEGNR